MESQIVLFSDEENAPDDPPAASTALAAASLGVGAAVILGSRGAIRSELCIVGTSPEGVLIGFVSERLESMRERESENKRFLRAQISVCLIPSHSTIGSIVLFLFLLSRTREEVF